MFSWLRFWKFFGKRPAAPSAAISSRAEPGAHIAGPISRLTHREPTVRKTAAESLGRLGPAARQAVPALVESLADSMKEVRTAARQALTQVDPSWMRHPEIALALQALVRGLSNRQPGVCEAAAEALSRIGGPAIPALTRALVDSEPTLRSDFRQMWAARALAGIGAAAVTAVHALVQALDSDYAFVREAAAEALGRIGRSAPEVVHALARALGHWHEQVRLVAVRALGRLGTGAVAVIDLLADMQPDVQGAAAEALVQMGLAAVPALRHAVENRADAVRQAKEHALKQTPDQAVPLFFQELERRDSHVRRVAAQLLDRISASTYEVVPHSPGLTEKERAAHFQLAKAEAEAEIAAWVLPPLLDNLADRDGVKRREAARALGRMGPLARPAVPALEKALNDVNHEIREAASNALKSILGFGFRGKNG